MGKKQIWLLSPLLDLLFLAGGLVWIFAAVKMYAPDLVDERSQSALLLIGSLTFTTTHFGLPLVCEKTNSAVRMLTGPRMIAFLAVNVLTAIFSDVVLRCFLQAYLCLVVLHYAEQNAQLVKTYLRRADFATGKSAALALDLGALSLALWSLCRQMEAGGSPASFLGVTLNSWPAVPQVVPAFFLTTSIISAILFLIIAGVTAARLNKTPPKPAILVIVSTGMMYCLTGRDSSSLWLFAPIFMHAIQSIAMHLSEVSAQDRMHRASLVAKSFFVGLGVSYCLPACFSFIQIPEQTAYAALISVFSFHHFVVEALSLRIRASRARDCAEIEDPARPTPAPAVPTSCYSAQLNAATRIGHNVASMFRSVL